MSDLKICIQCKHCTVGETDLEEANKAKCLIGPRSPVDGLPDCYCYDLRGEDGGCGPDGKSWEARSKPSTVSP